MALSACSCAWSQGVNDLFQTQRERPWAEIARFGAILTAPDQKQVSEDLMATNERLPAIKDPDGHWGSVVRGIQLGVRSATNVFCTNDEIHIYAFERNTTTNPVSIPHWASGLGLILMIQDASGTMLRTPPFSDSFFGSYPLSPKLQVKQEFEFKKWGIGLAPGTYKIWVLHEGFFRRDTGEMFYQTNECSGALTITVVRK